MLATIANRSFSTDGGLEIEGDLDLKVEEEDLDKEGKDWKRELTVANADGEFGRLSLWMIEQVASLPSTVMTARILLPSMLIKETSFQSSE